MIKPSNNDKNISILEKSYELIVPPGQTKIILVKADIEGFSLAARMSSVITWGDSKLREMAINSIEQKNKSAVHRKISDNIVCIQLKHEGGLYFLYKNDSEDQRLKETVSYQMEGLEIVGHEGSTKIEVSVNPSEEKIVKLKAVRGGWNCSQTIESKLENI